MQGTIRKSPASPMLTKTVHINGSNLLWAEPAQRAFRPMKVDSPHGETRTMRGYHGSSPQEKSMLIKEGPVPVQ